MTTTGTIAKVEFFRLSSDEHDRERFQRRRRQLLPFVAREVSIATPEDVIITKLRWALGAARGKDRDDVRDVIAVQNESSTGPTSNPGVTVTGPGQYWKSCAGT